MTQTYKYDGRMTIFLKELKALQFDRTIEYWNINLPICWDHLDRKMKSFICQYFHWSPAAEWCKGKWEDKRKDDEDYKVYGSGYTMYETLTRFWYFLPVDFPDAPTKAESLANYDYVFGHFRRMWDNYGKDVTMREATEAEIDAMKILVGYKDPTLAEQQAFTQEGIRRGIIKTFKSHDEVVKDVAAAFALGKSIFG